MGNYTGIINCDVVRGTLPSLPSCGEALCEAFSKTSHLLKAVSVATAAALCPFKARLVELMGASDGGSTASVLPGKGKAVHQVLALAVPRLFRERVSSGDFAIGHKDVEDYVDNAVEELLEERVPPLAQLRIGGEGDHYLSLIRKSAVEMASNFVKLMKMAHGKIIDVTRSRIRAELELYDYSMHVRGIADLVVEDPGEKKAVVIEWKTARDPWGGGKAHSPRHEEIAQAYVYALMVARRLGHVDAKGAVLSCGVVPVIIRDQGNIKIYSTSSCLPTAKRGVDEKNLLHDIEAAATYLLAAMVKLGGKEECKKKVQKELSARLKRFKLNPRGNAYPCNVCPLKDACLFYIMAREKREEIDRLSWRARYRVYDIRENALLPFYSLVVSGIPDDGKLEGGNRVDVFDTIEECGEGLRFCLTRKVRVWEAERGLPFTVREGKPVTIFLNDAGDLVLSTNFTGQVDGVNFSGEDVVVTVSFEGRFSRLYYFILRDLLEAEEDLKRRVVALESNVDLTQEELMAIDVFHRATKKAVKEGLLDEREAKDIAFRNGFAPKMKLYQLFGLA